MVNETFNTVVLHTGNGECHRPGTSSVKMKCNGIYELFFAGNISATTETTQVEIAIQVGGETLPETRMISMSEAAGDLNNVSTKTGWKNTCCDYDRVTITNIGTVPVNIGANPTFFVKRLA